MDSFLKNNEYMELTRHSILRDWFTSKRFVVCFLSMFSNIGFAKKTCMENGTWYISPLTNKTWTDFTGCSFEEQWRQSLNVSNYLKSLHCSFKI